MDGLNKDMADSLLEKALGSLTQEITLPHSVKLSFPIKGEDGNEVRSEVTFTRRPKMRDIKDMNLKVPKVSELLVVAAAMAGEPEWVFLEMDFEDAVRCGAVVMRFLPFAPQIFEALSDSSPQS